MCLVNSRKSLNHNYLRILDFTFCRTRANGALDDAYPDDKWVEESSGNAGVSVEHVYRKAALVVWPTKNTFRMLLASGISAAIDYTASEAARIGQASGDRARMRGLGDRLIDAWDEQAKQGRLYDTDGKKLRKMLAVLDSIGSAELTARFILKNAVSAYQGRGNDELADALAMAGADTAKDFLASFVRVQMPRHPRSVLDLLWRMTDTHWQGGTGAWRVPAAGSRNRRIRHAAKVAQAASAPECAGVAAAQSPQAR